VSHAWSASPPETTIWLPLHGVVDRALANVPAGLEAGVRWWSCWVRGADSIWRRSSPWRGPWRRSSPWRGPWRGPLPLRAVWRRPGSRPRRRRARARGRRSMTEVMSRGSTGTTSRPSLTATAPRRVAPFPGRVRPDGARDSRPQPRIAHRASVDENGDQGLSSPFHFDDSGPAGEKFPAARASDLSVPDDHANASPRRLLPTMTPGILPWHLGHMASRTVADRSSVHYGRTTDVTSNSFHRSRSLLTGA
jgi:hypothetical protein